MMDFNQAIILGNVTRDPELRTTPTGKSVISFSVATNRRWNSQDGQKQEQTEFHNVVAWGKLAEICNQIIYKGRKILVVGRLQTRNWEGQDGIKRYTTEIVADHVSATGTPKNAGESEIGTPTKFAPKSEPATSTQGAEAKKQPTDEINLDDIPF